MLAFYPSTTSYHHHQHRIPSRHRCNPFQRPSSYEYHSPSPAPRYEQYAHQLEVEEARHTAYAAALHRERAKLEREVAVARAMEHARLSQFATPEFSSSFLHHSHENRDEGLVTLGDLEALLRARDRRQAVQEAQSQRKKQLLEEQQRRLKFALEARERERRLKEEVERRRQQQRQQQQQQQKDLYEQLHRLMMIDFGDIWSHPENRDPLSRKNAMKKPSESSAAGPSVARKDEAPTKLTPTPATSTYDARLTALTVLDSLSNEYDSLISSFTFPTSLDFEAVPLSSTPVVTHKLAYSSLNAPVLAFEDSLMRLLQKLDSVESNGEEAVREVRRSLVKKVEKSLEALESRKEELWSGTEAGKEESSIKGKDIDRSAYPGLKSDSDDTLTELAPVVALESVTTAPGVDEETPLADIAVPAPVPVFEPVKQLADSTRSHEDVAGELPVVDSELVTSHADALNTASTENDSAIHSTLTDDVDAPTIPVDEIQFPPDEIANSTDTSLRLDVPIIASSNLIDELVPNIDQYVVPTTDFDTTTLERTASSAGDETALGGGNLTTYDFEMQDESSFAKPLSSPPSLSRIYTSSASNSDTDCESEVSVDSDTSLVQIEDDDPSTAVDKAADNGSVFDEDEVESVDEEDAQNFVVID